MRTNQSARSVGQLLMFFAAIIVIGVGLLLTWLTDWQPYFIWLASLSILTFLLYGYDKAQARLSGPRVPENVLHLLALAGGFPGGWAGRLVFRHKTRKRVFTLILSISTLLHLGLIYWVFIA